MSVIGEKSEEIVIDICNVSVAYPNGDGGTNTYDAPDGTAILAYHAIERGKGGNAGYNFSVLGDNSVFVSESIVVQKFQAIFDFLKNEKKEEYKTRVEELLNEAKRAATMTASTHSKLITKWHCHHDGSEFNRKGGNLNLAVGIILIKSLTTRNIDALITQIINAISRGDKPNEIKLVA
jgi:hypothetical protein